MNTGLRNGYCLLFHGFVDGNLVGNIHFVEFIDGADSIVCQHKGTSFNGEITCFFVLNNCSRQTSSRGGFARGINGARKKRANISGIIDEKLELGGGIQQKLLQKLGLRGRRITNDTYIDVASKMHALRCPLVDSSHQLQQNTFLDKFVTINGWRNTLHKPRVNVIGVNHGLQLFKFRFRECLNERLSTFFACFLLPSDVGANLQVC